MLCSLLTRNSFLILGVVISHLLVLLGLFSGSLGQDKSSLQGVLMVSLEGERTPSSNSKKSFASSPSNSLASMQSQSPAHADETSSSIGIEGASRLAGGAVRKAIHSPRPHYPLVSRQLREEGLVVVKLCVNAQGAVDEVGISKSSGFQSLDHSALRALASWRFDPIASELANFSKQCFQTPVQFTLEG